MDIMYNIVLYMLFGYFVLFNAVFIYECLMGKSLLYLFTSVDRRVDCKCECTCK